MNESQSLGQTGEDLAANLLLKKGFKILHRNWKSGRNEIDIIAENSDRVVFVEVKTRSNDLFVKPSDLVPVSKQRIIINAAHWYIKRFNVTKESRFDVITVLMKDEEPVIDHVEAAYYPTLR